LSTAKRMSLDVRPILDAGREPLGEIMDRLGNLNAPGDQLRLVAPFEPVPLYRVAEGEGFRHETVAQDDGTYVVTFTRRSCGTPP